jgi:hypothetical protein
MQVMLNASGPLAENYSRRKDKPQLSFAASALSMPCVWESVAPLARKSSASQASDLSLQTYCTTVATKPSTQPLNYMAAAIQNCMSEI